MIVVNYKENTVGLVVDTVSEVLDIPEGNVEVSPHFNHSEGSNNFISGMGKIEEKIKMIIDINALLFKDEDLLDALSPDEEPEAVES